MKGLVIFRRTRPLVLGAKARTCLKIFRIIIASRRFAALGVACRRGKVTTACREDFA